MKFGLFAAAALLILNVHQTRTEESIFKKLFNSPPRSEADRFPYLSQLPKRSIIRQKCVNSSNDFFVRPGSLQNACCKLDNHIRKYATGKGAWRYNNIRAEDRSELEEKALGRVRDDYNKQLTVITNATQTEFEAYLRKQGIDPENDPKTAAERKNWIYDREPQVVNLLFRMTKYKYEAKNELDDAMREKNLARAAYIEEAFAAIDSKTPPDDFVVK